MRPLQLASVGRLTEHSAGLCGHPAEVVFAVTGYAGRATVLA